MYEIMNHEKYEPVKKRGGNKEQPRIQEVIEEVDELQVTEEDTKTKETQGIHRKISFMILQHFTTC